MSLIFVLIISIFLAILIPSKGIEIGENDFLAYWSASKVLISGGNPYDPNALYEIQVSVRPHLEDHSNVMQAWNPPWLMLILSPFTLFKFNIASRIWIFCNVVLITLSLFLLWEMLFDPSDRKALYILLGAGFLFGNSIRLIQLGQVSSLLLIGLVIIIWFLNKELYFLAGATLLLLTTKPHITYLVLLVIFIWVIRYRKWELFFGFACSGILSIIIVWLIFPGWFGAFVQNIFTLPYSQIYTSTLGSFFESEFPYLKYFGLFLIPLAYPLSRYVDKSDWLTTLNLSIIISIPLAPYGFSFDHILYIPALVQMISWIWKKILPLFYAWVVGSGIVVMYLIIIYMGTVQMISYSWFVWPSVAFSGLYLLGWRKKSGDN